MTTAYTSLLGLALPVTGELSGTWGDTVNDSITSLLDSAVAGTTTISSDADVTLTTTTGASNTSRQAILLWTAGGTVTRNITAPAQSKIYTVINKSSSTQSIVLRGAGPTTGVTIVQGESAVCAWNGSDFIKISNTSGAGVFTTLSVSGAVTLSGGTANGVAYLNGSKVLTTGSALTFDGSTFAVTGLTTVTSSGNSSVTTGIFANTSTGTSAINRFRLNGGTSSAFFEVQGSGFSGTNITNGPTTSALVVWTGSNIPVSIGVNGYEIGRFSSTGLAVTGTFSSTLGATIQGLTVGLGAGAVFNNTAVGVGVLQANSSGGSSAGVGYQALYSATSGAHAALGQQALYSNTSGTYNSAVGYQAGYSNTTGANNVAIGAESLRSNTTASNNTAVGYQAAYSNTTGTDILAIGYIAGYSNTTGNSLLAIGGGALYANTTGTANTAVGNGLSGTSYAALRFNTTGNYNTAIGVGSLANNTTANSNTAVGYQAGYSNTTGVRNTYIGDSAGYSGTTAEANTAVGKNAGNSLTSGSNNTLIGGRSNSGTNSGAGFSLTTGGYNNFFGGGAGGLVTTGSKNTILGNFDGNQGGLDIRTGGNYIVLSDGDGTPMIVTYTGATVALQGAGYPQTGTGIQFPATQNASTNANTLDDYEEGTWTPVLAFGGASVGITYAARGGTYTKIGRLVTGRFVIVLSSKGSSTGNATIEGLPFTVGADLGSAITEICSNFVSGPPTQGYCSNTGTNIVPWAISATGTTIPTDTNFANNTRLDMWFQYNV